MEQFVAIEMHDAFEFDCLVTSHPIYSPVNDPDEIAEIFDGISYSKVNNTENTMVSQKRRPAKHS